MELQFEKVAAFPHLHKIEEGGVVTIWKAKKNQEKNKDQQRNTLKGVE